MFRDYERMHDYDTTFRRKIRETLNNLFFGNRKAGEMAGIPKKKAVERPLLEDSDDSEGFCSKSAEHNDAIVYEFKVVPKKRFESIDLELLYDKEEKPNLSQIVDAKDRKLIGVIEKTKPRKSQENFIACFKCVAAGDIPEELKSIPIKQKRKPEKNDEDVLKTRDTLIELRRKYGKSVEEIKELYSRVSEDLETLKLLLEGKKVQIWTDLEDLALQASAESAEYKSLVKVKGEAEVKKRKKFLGLTIDQHDFE
eukprot:TRINITY_DN1205_c0_g1_i2.p5 TRINITY_DN1205_c0_g1~~TRINITY_DN1205_c0_g1_i2.p5  ORF type:complete len:254 (+),score=44.73 TRINITY_DN1205_c0_g1_i2:2701-3462(+)